MRCVPIHVVFVVSMLGTAYDAPAQQKSVGGLVVNGGFELDADTDGMPDGWTFTADPEDRFVRGLRTRSSHTGHYAFCIENAPWRRGTTPEAPILSSSSFDLKPRVTYRISVWLKQEGPFRVERVGIRIKTNTEGTRGGRRFDLEVTREWTKYTVNLLTEADTRTGALEIIGGDNWVDRLFMDDLEVTETDIATDANLPLCWHPWLPAPAPIYKTDLTGFTFPNHHPRLGHTPAEIEEMVRSMAGQDIREHAWVQSADPWLERPLFFFAEPAPNSPSARSCPACRATLKPYAETEETYGMECPECRTRHTGDKHRCRARELVARDQSNGAVLLGQAYEHADKIQKETVDAVLIRRRGSGTVFGAVWEPYRRTPSISQITALPVQGQSGTPDNAQGVGLEVTRRGHESAECFLASYSPGLKRFGDIELDGQLAAGRWRDRDSEPEFAQLAAGVLLRRGAHSIEATVPASIYVERIGPDRLRVKTGSGGEGQLTIVGRISAGARVERDRDGVAATVEEGKTLSFHAAEGSTYEVSGLREWTRVSLACEGRAERLARVSGPATATTEGLRHTRETYGHGSRLGHETGHNKLAVVHGALQPDPDIDVPRCADGALEGTNKIANASFEINPYTGSNVADVASPWEHRNSRYTANFAQRHRTGRIGYDYDPSEAHSGEYSVKLIAKVMSGATAQRRIEQKVATRGAGKTYTFSAWVKASMAGTKVRLCLYGWNPNWGRDFTGGVSPEFVVGKEWMRISWTRTFGPEITDVYAMVKREYQILGGDVWVDDVQLEEGQRTSDFVADVWTKTAQTMQKEPANANHNPCCQRLPVHGRRVSGRRQTAQCYPHHLR